MSGIGEKRCFRPSDSRSASLRSIDPPLAPLAWLASGPWLALSHMSLGGVLYPALLSYTPVADDGFTRTLALFRPLLCL